MDDPRLTDGELCDIIGRMMEDYQSIPSPDVEQRKADARALLKRVLGEHYDYTDTSFR